MEIYNKLFKTLKQGDLLLTPKQRLIYALHKSYAAYQQTHDKQAWPSLQILKLETWLSLQWETQLIKTTGFNQRLLTTAQEHAIWQSIIETSDTHFLIPTHIAKTAQQAWKIQTLWQLNANAKTSPASNETRLWQSWAERFIARCKDYACIDLARATTLLITCFKNRCLIPPARVFLVGFDELNPQTKNLLQVLEELGSQISYFVASIAKPCVHRLAMPNIETELQTMARWAYQQWQAGKKNILCAVPQLVEIRREVLATFTEVFTQLNPSLSLPLPFNIDAGKKLSEFGLLQSGLTIIQTQASNTFGRTNKLIQSPYMGFAQAEKSQRAQLSIYLRCHAETTLALKQLVILSQQQHCPQLSQLLCNMLAYLDPLPLQQLPSQWATHFVKKLQSLHWPGERHLSKEDFQLIERWSELLDAFCSLDFILGEITEEKAVQQLTQGVEDTFFQAKTQPDTPIHILGLLDTAGLCADSLWVMGLDDKAWPASARPNPFIPYALQRAHATPHASNEREFYFASSLSQRLLHSADVIIVSYTAQHNAQPSSPSALIRHLPVMHSDDLALPAYQSKVQSIWKTQAWEYYVDDTAPALLPNERPTVGSQLFKSQAACPFQAFAKFRLGSEFHALPTLGLNQSDRGRLLHRVIELFWNKIGDQARLLQQSSQTLLTLSNQSIDTAIAEFSKKRPRTFKQHFITIERERLQQRLMKLIVLDKNRPSFTHVIHEQKKTFNFANLTLNLRIDRIDTLSNGSALIIDYKTGYSKPLGWSEERLNEPQLPLYCLSLPNVKGCSVIHIGSNTIHAQGYSEQETGLSQLINVNKDKNLAPTWPELLNFWKIALEKLAAQFQAGVATVDPKHGETTCLHCHLQLFCRVNQHAKSN